MTLGSSSGWFEVLQEDLVRQRIPLSSLYQVDFEKYGRYDSDYVAKATVNMNLAHVLDDGFSLSSVLMFIQKGRQYTSRYSFIGNTMILFQWGQIELNSTLTARFRSFCIRPFVRSFPIVFPCFSVSHCFFHFFSHFRISVKGPVQCPLLACDENIVIPRVR